MTQTQPPLPEVHDNKLASAHHLETLEVRRQALERLINIARSVEWLRVGLETTLALGESVDKLPPSALSLYEALGRKMRNLSDAEVKLRLQRLDKKLQFRLQKVVTATESLDMPDSAAEDTHIFFEINQQIDEFRRLAQTSAALRVLLGRRGVKADSLALAIPQKALRHKVKAAQTREKQCRNQVVSEIQSMAHEVKRMIARDACSEKLRSVLECVLGDLAQNREHISSGKSIQELPFAIDVIDMSYVGSSMEPFPEAKPAQDEEPQGEKGEAAAEAETVASETAETQPVGLWQAIVRWLNTPWSVSFKDIFKNK